MLSWRELLHHPRSPIRPCRTLCSTTAISGRVDAPSLALQPQRGLLLADVNLAASLVKKSADGLAQKCQRPDTKASLSPQQLELLSQALHVPVAPLQTLLQSCPELHHVSGAQLSAAISKVATELQLPLSDARALAARQPVMVLQAQPGELATATTMLAQHLALPFRKVATAAVSIPSILKRDPAVVLARLAAMATVLGSLPMHVMLRMAAAAPEYLTARPAALGRRLALYSRLLGRPTHMLLSALQQQPDLLFLGPRVLLNKVKVLQSVLNKPMRQVLPLVLACPELMRADMDQVRQAQEVLAKQVSKSSGHAYAMVCHCPRLLLQPPAQLLARTRSLQQACQACASWAGQWGRLSPAQVADCLACTRATYSRLQLLTHCGRAAGLPLHQALTMRKAAFLKLLVQALPAPAPGPVLNPAPGPVLNPAPGPVLNPAPGPVLNPAPGPVLNPAPGPVLNPAPGPVLNQAPGPVLNPAPGSHLTTAALPPPAPQAAPRDTTAPAPALAPAALLAAAAPSPWCPDPAYSAPPLRPECRAGGSGTAGQGGQPFSELPPPLSPAVSCLPPGPGAIQARPAQQQAPRPATWLPAAAGAGSSADLAQPRTPQQPTPPHATRLPAAGGVPPQGWQLQLHHAHHQPLTQSGTSAGAVGGLQLQGPGAGAGPGVGGGAQAGVQEMAGPEAVRTLGGPTQGWVGVRQRRERHRRSRAQAGQWAGQVGGWEQAPDGGSNQQQEQGTGVGGQCVAQPSMGERAWLSQQWAGPGREGGRSGCAGGLQSQMGPAQLQGHELQELAQLSGQQECPGQLQQLAPVGQQGRPRPASSRLLHTVHGPDQPAGAPRAQVAPVGAARARAAEGAGAGAWARAGERQGDYLSVWNSHSCSGHSPLNGVRDRQGSSRPGGRAASSAAGSSSDGGGDSACLQQAGRGSLMTCRSDIDQGQGGHTVDSTSGGALFMANGTHSSATSTSTFTTCPDLSASSSGGTSSGGSSSMGGGARSSWPRLCLTYRRHSKQRHPRHLRPRSSRVGRRKPLAATPLPPPSQRARRQPPPSPTPATPISAGRTAILAAAGRALGASMVPSAATPPLQPLTLPPPPPPPPPLPPPLPPRPLLHLPAPASPSPSDPAWPTSTAAPVLLPWPPASPWPSPVVPSARGSQAGQAAQPEASLLTGASISGRQQEVYTAELSTPSPPLPPTLPLPPPMASPWPHGLHLHAPWPLDPSLPERGLGGAGMPGPSPMPGPHLQQQQQQHGMQGSSDSWQQQQQTPLPLQLAGSGLHNQLHQNQQPAFPGGQQQQQQQQQQHHLHSIGQQEGRAIAERQAVAWQLGPQQRDQQGQHPPQPATCQQPPHRTPLHPPQPLQPLLATHLPLHHLHPSQPLRHPQAEPLQQPQPSQPLPLQPLLPLQPPPPQPLTPPQAPVQQQASDWAAGRCNEVQAGPHAPLHQTGGGPPHGTRHAWGGRAHGGSLSKNAKPGATHDCSSGRPNVRLRQRMAAAMMVPAEV